MESMLPVDIEDIFNFASRENKIDARTLNYER